MQKVYTVFNASAPGSLMLAGEHAVLHGYPALCMPVKQRIQVSLTPQADNNIVLTSNAFTPLALSKQQISLQKPYQFVLGALQSVADKMPSGCSIHIEASFSHTIGFGSSAAVTVATVKVLRQWLQLSQTLPDIMQHARQVVRQVQGRGSGADVAASTYDNIVYYHQEDLAPRVIAMDLPLVAIYCGYKTATVDVIKQVESLFLQQEGGLHAMQNIFKQIGDCTEKIAHALAQQDLPAVGKLMNQHFVLQQALHTSDTTIDAIGQLLLQQPHILGAKISGSGLGDCVIGLGHLSQLLFPTPALPLTQQISL